MNLDKRITIQRRGEAQDGAGQRKPTWTNQGTYWASVRPVSGREYHSASGPRSEVTHEILLRHGATLAPRDRITLGSRQFDVVSVFNLEERSRYLKLMATENADNGL